ncbi:hypothetical protein [Novispirillum itersonii]|uniref:hypothetical protein n=1 Tax=Novispirillum itersonii TaxID=189 RepID=UPI000374C407|nr:hypothetical protein [Novispirillum itersonii]
MTATRHHPVSNRRAALFALALLAAFVRVVFAPGYMPQTAPDGSPLSLVICTPGGVTSLAHPGMDGTSSSIDPPCAFAAVNTLSAAPDILSAPLPRLLPRAADRALPPLQDVAEMASPLPLGARAPPRLMHYS